MGPGDRAVGMTLLAALGVAHSVTDKPRFHGMVISARRGTRASDVNRVNLFAKVPDWEISTCKSSAEILKLYGYDREIGKKLYCTVRYSQPNSQGLYLEIDPAGSLLHEKYRGQKHDVAEVACWNIGTLKDRLYESHPESVWVLASSSKLNGVEYFHYRFARFTSAPNLVEFPNLLKAGTITMDHLISQEGNRVVEKGPLFKISPHNVSSLFPTTTTFDLMNF